MSAKANDITVHIATVNIEGENDDRRTKIIKNLIEVGFELNEKREIIWDGGRGVDINRVLEFIIGQDLDVADPLVMEIPFDLTPFYDEWEVRRGRQVVFIDDVTS